MRTISRQTVILLAVVIGGFSACARSRDVAQTPIDRSSASEDRTALSSFEVLKDAGVRTYQIEHPPRAVRSGIGELAPEGDKLNTNLLFLHRLDSGPVNAIEVSADGTMVLTGHQNGDVHYHRLIDEAGFSENGGSGGPHMLSELIVRSGEPVLAMALSPGGSRLAIGQLSRVSIVDLQARRLERVLTKIDGRVTALAWDPRDELLSAGLASGEVYVWRLVSGPDAGLDSLRALESYLGGQSAIVRLIFHPSGRSLFVAEGAGTLSVWRLLRTERELGIRDEVAVVDRRDIARWRFAFAQLPSDIKDMLLSRDGSNLFVAAADGGVYRWKVRGLRQQSGLKVQESAVFNIAELSVPDGTLQHSVLVSSGRGGKLMLWCERPTAAIDETATSTLLTPSEVEEESLEGEAVASGAFADPTVSGQVSSSSKNILGYAVTEDYIRGQGPSANPQLNTATQPALEFSQLQQPLILLQSGRESSILWAVEKTGNLLAFDSKALRNLSDWNQALQSCTR